MSTPATDDGTVPTISRRTSLQRRRSTGIQYYGKRRRPEDEEKSNEKKDDSDNTCPVCMNEMELPFKTKCKHTFCYLCLKNVARLTSAVCPLCRGALDQDQIRTAEVEGEMVSRRFSFSHISLFDIP